MAASTAAWSRVGDWTAMPPSLKATTPTMTPGRLTLDEGLGRFARGLHAGRLEVGRGHAARDVEGAG